MRVGEKIGKAGIYSFCQDLFFFFFRSVGRLVVLRFNATLTAMVISWRSVTHMCFLAFSHQYNFSFQSHRLLFSHASAEVRGENSSERKVASTGDRTHNHQVMSPTRSPLSQPGSVFFFLFDIGMAVGEKTGKPSIFTPFATIVFFFFLTTVVELERKLVNQAFTPFATIFFFSLF